MLSQPLAKIIHKKYKEESALLCRVEKKFANCTHTLEETQKKPKDSDSKKIESPILTSSKISRNDKKWLIKKWSKNETIRGLIEECLAQELHRLILDPAPYGASLQPKTRILHLNNGEMALLSEKVDFTPLADVKECSAQMKQGKITGIGSVSAMAYIVAERDRHRNNLGIDSAGQMISLDCQSFRTSSSYEINAQVIQQLPWITKQSTYRPVNYFGLMHYNKDKNILERNEKSGLVTPQMATNPSIQQEKYGTFLTFIILPDTLLRHFVAAYTDDQDFIKYYSDFLIRRKNKLLAACLELKDFKDYCVSPQARIMVENYLHLLRQFKTMHKNYLCDDPVRLVIWENYIDCKKKAGFKKDISLLEGVKKNRLPLTGRLFFPSLDSILKPLTQKSVMKRKESGDISAVSACSNEAGSTTQLRSSTQLNDPCSKTQSR